MSGNYQTQKTFSVSGVLSPMVQGQLSTWRHFNLTVYLHNDNDPEKRFQIVGEGYQYQMGEKTQEGEQTHKAEFRQSYWTPEELEAGWSHATIQAFNYLVGNQQKVEV